MESIVSSTEEKMESKVAEAAVGAAVIWEAVIDKTVTSFTGGLAWMNAGLLSMATEITFTDSMESDLAMLGGMWTYFFVLTAVLSISAYCLQDVLNWEGQPEKKTAVKLPKCETVVVVVERNIS